MREKDIHFARLLIGHLARVNQELEVEIYNPEISESDLPDVWHFFDMILVLLKCQFHIDIKIRRVNHFEKYFPLMTILNPNSFK